MNQVRAGPSQYGGLGKIPGGTSLQFSKSLHQFTNIYIIKGNFVTD